MLISAVPAIASEAPVQASKGGRVPLRIQTIGNIRTGVSDERVETMPTSPR